jgi:lipoprotein-anchoring transpeptidase ErfK/SrfK
MKYIVAAAMVAAAFLTGSVYAENKMSSGDAIAQAEQAESQGKFLEALASYNAAFDGITDPAKLQDLNAKIENLNVKILYSPIVDGDSEAYTVQSGDSLTRIAKKYDTTVALIRKANSLKRDALTVGQKLKVVKASFSVFIDKSQCVLFLKKGETIVKTYRVATGKENCTPVGEFTITTKLENPVHFRRDISTAVESGSDKNLLGTRWLGLSVAGYGIHGHATDDDLGKKVSLGCIRMLNKDVEELYDILPMKTKVTIVD